MSKLLCVISCPIDSYSGYGSRSRDIVKSLIDLYDNEWDIKILPQRWGNTSWGYIDDHSKEWGYLNNYLLKVPQLPKQPEIWVQITVPNEFQPVGKFNIGITAGIETTVCDSSWIEGCNRMNLILTSSQHSKEVFLNSKFDKVNPTGQLIGKLELISPIEVLFEGVNLDIFKKQISSGNEMITEMLSNIKEDFCFLSVGHWMHGDLGQDRKDIGMLVKVFFEVFKNKKNQPALILKTSGAISSIMDRDEILKKIDLIRKTCKGDLPNVYILHGELSDSDMNDLYNLSKVKAMVSFTKGEGFGRPLLEFSITQKPVIVSAWSGPLDFIKHGILLQGNINKLHPSSVIPNMLLAESGWFTVDYSHAGSILKNVYEKYNDYLDNGKRQAFYSKTNFSLEKMKEKLKEILSSKLPEFPKEVKLVLPKIKKIKFPKKEEIKND